MEEIRYFELSELKVDQNNFRLGSFKSQRDAIRAMLTRHKSKLLPLAKDILEVGLSPGEPIWVAPDPEIPGKYIVMEGNRRITALKVMNSPALADGTTASDAFRKLGKEFLTKPRREIRATVFESIEAAKPWVERRHLNCRIWVLQRGYQPILRLNPPAVALKFQRTDMDALRVKLDERFAGLRLRDFYNGFSAGRRTEREGLALADIEAEWQQTYPRLRLFE